MSVKALFWPHKIILVKSSQVKLIKQQRARRPLTCCILVKLSSITVNEVKKGSHGSPQNTY